MGAYAIPYVALEDDGVPTAACCHAALHRMALQMDWNV